MQFSQSANFFLGKRKIRTFQQRKYDLYYNSLDSIIPTTLYLVNEKILSTAVLNVDFHMKNEPRKSHVQYLYFILCHWKTIYTKNSGKEMFFFYLCTYYIYVLIVLRYRNLTKSIYLLENTHKKNYSPEIAIYNAGTLGFI